MKVSYWVYSEIINTNYVLSHTKSLLDHLNVQADQQNLNPGRIVILPSFKGSPRAMRQNYMDAMAIVCKYGKPDLFLTFTCNPRWPEIVDNLFPGQTASDRPDLVSRVFNMKVKMLMDDIHKRFVLGKTVANVYVIEFQKRGLPHVHMLIHLDEADKLRDADDIDSLISAEIPDPDEHPALYETVKSCMVHGPCGALNPSSVCMAEGKCTKEFPKPYKETTANNVNGYPQYRRRENGRTVNVRGVDLDNRWIVPYNSYLSSKYNAHINLEACMTVHAVKYLYKYLYKGHDCATVEINERLDHDEVKTFVDARYVSAPEASWRLFSFKLHDKSHVIFRLAVHLPAQEMVYFHEGEEQAAAERAENRHTHLTAWFKLNRENPDANQYLYQEIPHHFTFDQNRKEWKVRRRNSNKIISRMYASHPKENERFFLRMLLLHVPGATSFQHLQTYNGEVYPTFREACIARGFLESDEEWERTLQEVSAIGSPKQLRQTFSFLLTHAEVNNPSELWRNHRHGMIEDFLRTMSEANAEISALTFIAGIIRQSGKKLTDFNLPDIDQVPEEPELNILEMAQEVDEIRPTLNQDQSNVAENVISSVTNVHNGDIQNNRVFFLDAPGGTGKTYTINYIIKVLQSRGMKVATCAWTGIAATLLEKGLTVHSLFRLPVPIIETSTCNIPPTSDKAAFLMEQDLIVCDEVSMVPKHALEAIDKALRDIANNDSLFGGKVFLLSGDFRQILPVVRRARPAEIIEVCLKSSYIWNYIQVYNLRLNMRANENQQVFIQWLLNLGSGQILLKDAEPFKDCIELPQRCILPQNASLIDAIFLDNENDLSSRVILSTTNDDALKMNNDILGKLPGDSVNYLSADSIVTDDVEERALYPQEFLNSITPSGMPPHCLKLKVNCIVMLLRNLDLKAGLCNGTRLIVRGLRENVIDAEIITGIAVGTRVLIPKIALSPSDTGLPFQLRRRQFPLRLSYCMTINKAQGQTFNKVGIFLRRPCFSHGQLYVAFSRARSFDDIIVKIVQNESQGSVRNKHYTKNVVYPQVL